METTKNLIDVHHPLYLHPLDTHITSLVPQVLLDSTNYVVWSRAMRLALRGKNKIGFLDGTFTRTHASEHKDLWKHYDAVVLSWLIQSVDKDIANGIVFANYSHNVWQDLQKRFNKEEDQQNLSIPTSISPLNGSALTTRGGRQGHGRGRGRSQDTSSHCNKKGHKRDTCYQLIGYPPNLNRRNQDNHINPAVREANTSQSTSSPPTLTHKQYNQILQLHKKDSD